MHYWIDGYNLFFRLTKSYRALKKEERNLLETLCTLMTRLQSPLTVVFDGREKDPPEPLLRNLRALRIIYTPATQTADDYILEALDHISNPADEMVVSSDSELLRKAKQKGARTQTVEAFIRHLATPKKSPAHERKQSQETSTQFTRLLAIFQKKLEDGEGL